MGVGWCWGLGYLSMRFYGVILYSGGRVSLCVLGWCNDTRRLIYSHLLLLFGCSGSNHIPHSQQSIKPSLSGGESLVDPHSGHFNCFSSLSISPHFP